VLSEPTAGYFATQIGTTFIVSTLDPGDNRTVIILSEPRPEEPTGLGAVVEADSESVPTPRRVWTRITRWWTGDNLWHDGAYLVKWSDLIDPVVLHEGWTPSTDSPGFAAVYNTALCTHCDHQRSEHTLSMNGCRYTSCPCAEFTP
jgi:hypothetical protein